MDTKRRCKTKGCSNIAREGRLDCHTCHARECNKRFKEKFINGELSLEPLIKRWIRNTGRKDRRGKNRKLKHSRKKLKSHELFKLSKKALKIFPDLVFFTGTGKSCINSASLDRIDSNKGYTYNNIQIVPRWYNLGKSNSSDEEFQLNITKYVVQHNLIEKFKNQLN